MTKSLLLTPTFDKEPEYFSGKNLVVVNREPTPADSRASLVIRDSVAKVLGAI